MLMNMVLNYLTQAENRKAKIHAFAEVKSTSKQGKSKEGFSQAYQMLSLPYCVVFLFSHVCI